MSDEDVALFVSITGIEDREAVLHYLEAYGDLNTAVAAALDGHGPPQQAPPRPQRRDTGAQAAPRAEAGVVPAAPLRIPFVPSFLSRAIVGTFRVTFNVGLQVARTALRVLRYTPLRALTDRLVVDSSGAAGPQRAPAASDPTAAAAAFCALFQSLLPAGGGTRNPEFLPLSYGDAVRAAQRQNRLLFVYLHCASHQHTAQFCSDVLTSTELNDWLRDHCVCWGGDVRASEAYQLSGTLRHSTWPLVALLAPPLPGSSRPALAAFVEGKKAMRGAGEILRVFNRAQQEVGAHLVAQRAQQEEREHSRRLREEQDAAYQQSLEEDRRRREQAEARQREQEAAAKAAAEEEAARQAAAAAAQREAEERAAAVVRRREEAAAALESEPAEGEPATQVVVRLPDGTRAQRRFRPSSPLSAVYRFVDAQQALGFHSYRLVASYPKKAHGRSEVTLEEAGLHPQAVLFLEEAEDE